MVSVCARPEGRGWRNLKKECNENNNDINHDNGNEENHDDDDDDRKKNSKNNNDNDSKPLQWQRSPKAWTWSARKLAGWTPCPQGFRA